MLYEVEGRQMPSRSGLRRLLDAVHRYRWMVVTITGAFVALGALVTFLIPSYYQASGSVIISRPDKRFAEIRPAEPYSYDEDREIQTEMSELKSHAVAQMAIGELNLMQRDPEIRQAIENAETAARSKGKTLTEADKMETAEDVFLSKLTLAPDKLSRIVTVTYGSHDPAVAAETVNRAVNDFINFTFQSRGQTGRRLAAWLGKQIDGTRQQMLDDEAALVKFQGGHKFVPLIVPGGDQGVLLSQLAAANNQLTSAATDRITDEAWLQVYPTATEELPVELRTPAVDQAVADVTEAKKEYDTLASEYQPTFAPVVEAKDRLAMAQAHLQSLQSDVKTALEKRVEAAKEREAGLQNLMAQLTGSAVGESGTELKYQILKAKSDADRALFNALQEKEAEATLLASMPNSNVTILDTASTPAVPIYPSLKIDEGVALFLGLALGLLAALVRYRMAGAITGNEEGITQYEGLGSLGLIPDRQRVLEGDGSSSRLLPSHAAGGVGISRRMLESYAKVAANIVARAGGARKSILVTSAGPGEGKTETVCNLALALARMGWKTIVIDADVRHPGCHEFFGIKNDRGLLALQEGHAVEPVAVATNLDVLPCETSSDGQLRSRAFEAMLETVSTNYDFALIDSPPTNLTGDAVTLSQTVNGVVLVMRWATTRTREAQAAVAELLQARAPMLGTVLNGADLSAPEFRSQRRRGEYFRAAAA
jgi:succinoglycan biosynthesis transport protein ExoP